MYVFFSLTRARQYVVDTSIAGPFAAFQSGFQRIVGDNRAIALLDDLELVSVARTVA